MIDIIANVLTGIVFLLAFSFIGFVLYVVCKWLYARLPREEKAQQELKIQKSEKETRMPKEKAQKIATWVIIVSILLIIIASCSGGKSDPLKSTDSITQTSTESGEEITHFSMQQEEVSDNETIFTGTAKPGIGMTVENYINATIFDGGTKKKKIVVKCDALGKFSVKVDSIKSELYQFTATINGKKINSYQSTVTEKDKIKEWKEMLGNEKRLKLDRVKTPSIQQLKKSPKKYDGHYVIYKGEVLEAKEEGEYTHLRVAVSGDMSNVIYIKYQGKTRAVEGSNVTIYGMVDGEFSYKSQAGWDISLPEIIAEIIARG